MLAGLVRFAPGRVNRFGFSNYELSRRLTCPAHKGQMEGSLTLHSVVFAASEQVSCPLGEESAILNLKSSSYYGLDPVGTLVWNLLRQPRCVGDIRDALLQEYDVDAERCERDLLDLLLKMREEGLIEVRVAPAT